VLVGGSELLNAVATALAIIVCNSLFWAAVNAVSSSESIRSLEGQGFPQGKREGSVTGRDAGDRQVFLMSEAKFVGENSEPFPLPFRTQAVSPVFWRLSFFGQELFPTYEILSSFLAG